VSFATSVPEAAAPPALAAIIKPAMPPSIGGLTAHSPILRTFFHKLPKCLISKGKKINLQPAAVK
jgi:hypothetical protein